MILEAQGIERDCEVKEESDLELCLEHVFFFPELQVKDLSDRVRHSR